LNNAEDVLKNPCNVTRFFNNTHDCKSYSFCIYKNGWQTYPGVYKVSPQEFFSTSSALMKVVYG